jgi:hypothetical protein
MPHLCGYQTIDMQKYGVKRENTRVRNREISKATRGRIVLRAIIVGPEEVAIDREDKDL